PSPTGSLHIGGARTALFNYLFAQNQNGSLVLRVEDTDIERNTTAALKSQLADLNWLGISWDEGVNLDGISEAGKFGPYKQSQRLDIYQKYLNQMLESGLAYYCFLTDEEIDQQREQAKQANQPYQVHSPYRDQSLAHARQRITQGDAATVRFKTPDQVTQYPLHDLVRGSVTFPSDMVADFVIQRANGMPVYNFCCVIDDSLMEITHVFRGEEHLPNTLRQLMLYEALEKTAPQFGHLSIILGEDKKKLSKRQGAVSCAEFREQGFLPQALLNYIALLGWSAESGDEIFTLAQLCDAFSADRLNASAAVFDRKKLEWVNSQHIRRLPADQLWEAMQPWLTDAQLDLPTDTAWRQKSVALFAPNLTTLNDALALYRPFDQQAFQIHVSAHEALQWPSSKLVIEQWLAQLHACPHGYLTQHDLQTISKHLQSVCQVKGKTLFMPLRIAMIGQPQGAELKLLVELLPKTQLIERAQQALAAI
nr:glutamate--tRNA ligase [Legionellales bacterium]